MLLSLLLTGTSLHEHAEASSMSAKEAGQALGSGGRRGHIPHPRRAGGLSHIHISWLEKGIDRHGHGAISHILYLRR